jgi:hypothetical protein
MARKKKVDNGTQLQVMVGMLWECAMKVSHDMVMMGRLKLRIYNIALKVKGNGNTANFEGPCQVLGLGLEVPQRQEGVRREAELDGTDKRARSLPWL